MIGVLHLHFKSSWYFLQDAAHDKYLKMGEKDSEIRQLKMALRERDHDIERANQMLLTTEETIDVSMLILPYQSKHFFVGFYHVNKFIDV